MKNNEPQVDDTQPSELVSNPIPKRDDEIVVSEVSKQAFIADEPPQDLLNDDEQGEEDEAESILSLSFAKRILKVFALLGLFIGFVLLMFTFVFKTYFVDGLSMFPTLNNDDRLVLWVGGKTWSTITRADHIPKRGEIVVVKSPIDESADYVKRVIALPGERVVLKDGVLLVYNQEFPNGFDPNQTFVADLRATAGEVDMTVPDGHIFVVGDNREEGGSEDSRNSVGTIPNQNIIGKVILRFVPVQEFKTF